jgi:excisionase family DNA binding protein
MADGSGVAECLTVDVPTAGKRYLGLSRNAAYAAAERGEIPTIRVGRLLRVPVRAMEALLDAASRLMPYEQAPHKI